MSYKRIIVELYNKKITLTPIKLYLVRDPGLLLTDSKVVIYQIDCLDLNTRKITRAEIPYYISDGHTNHLRANMLYPFMSFNMEANLNSPYLAGKEGLLFKYKIGTNISTKLIEEWIRHSFVKYYNHHGFNGKDILKSLDSVSEGHRIGVTSVLIRLTNLLDYFISILSPDVISFQTRDIRCYRPIYAAEHVSNKYNIDFCDTSGEPHKYDKYKFFILRALEDQIKHLLRYKIFVIEDIALIETEISRVNFNNLMLICTNPNYGQNVANYVEISIILHRNIKTYIIHILQTPIEKLTETFGDLVNESFFNFMRQFNMLLLDNTILTSESAEKTLSTTILGLGATCRQSGAGLVYRSDNILGEKLEKSNNNTINHIPNVYTNIETLIKNNDIRAVNGHTITEKMLKKLYKEYKSKYLSLKQEYL